MDTRGGLLFFFFRKIFSHFKEFPLRDICFNMKVRRAGTAMPQASATFRGANNLTKDGRNRKVTILVTILVIILGVDVSVDTRIQLKAITTLVAESTRINKTLCRRARTYNCILNVSFVRLNSSGAKCVCVWGGGAIFFPEISSRGSRFYHLTQLYIPVAFSR